jgi:hypothetical protein
VARRMAEAEEMGLDRNGPQVFRQFVDLLEQTAELRRVGFACDFRDDTMCDEDDAAWLFRHVLPSHPTLESIQIFHCYVSVAHVRLFAAACESRRCRGAP